MNDQLAKPDGKYDDHYFRILFERIESDHTSRSEMIVRLDPYDSLGGASDVGYFISQALNASVESVDSAVDVLCYALASLIYRSNSSIFNGENNAERQAQWDVLKDAVLSFHKASIDQLNLNYKADALARQQRSKK